MTPVAVVASLSSEQLKKIALKYGAPTVLGLYSWLTQRREGQAYKQQVKTLEEMQRAIPELMRMIESKEIRVVAGAFNSSAVFLSTVQTAAFVAIAIILLDLTSAIKRVGSALVGIQSELAISNVAKIRGWEKHGYGFHIHRFARNEMNAARSQDQTKGHEKSQHHFFYIWNPDTDWYPVFEEEQRKAPLGSNLGGYHSDLATICDRMRCDRETLIRTTSCGRSEVFRLLIPTYTPLVMDDQIQFHDELLRLVISGDTHRGVSFVWLALRQCQETLGLNYVGVLLPQENKIRSAAGIGQVCGVCGFVGFAVGSVAFPPMAPFLASTAVPFWGLTATSMVAKLGADIHDVETYRRPRMPGGS